MDVGQESMLSMSENMLSMSEKMVAQFYSPWIVKLEKPVSGVLVCNVAEGTLLPCILG